ncbi:MAG: hypothetical protein ACOCPM_04625 [Bacteroidales bacterium]
MIRKIVLSVFIAGLFLTGLKAHSQQIADIESFSDTVNTSRYLKFHLTTIFEIEPALQLAYSYPVWDGRFQMQHELGYVTWNRTYYFWERNKVSYHGVRMRNQLRHYFLTKSEANKDKKNRDTKRNYVAIDAMYKYGNIWQERTVWHQDGIFSERMGIVTHKHVAAIHAVIGKESEFLAGSGTIFDYYAGVGFRYKSLHSKKEDLISDYSLSPFFYDDNKGPLYFLSVMAGIRIGFEL